jgi:hypothetical protein
MPSIMSRSGSKPKLKLFDNERTCLLKAKRIFDWIIENNHNNVQELNQMAQLGIDGIEEFLVRIDHNEPTHGDCQREREVKT